MPEYARGKPWARRILKALNIEDRRVTEVVLEITKERVAVHTTRLLQDEDMERLEAELQDLEEVMD